MAQKKDEKRAPCAACNGSGLVAWADGHVVCGVCGGKGTVKP